LAQATRLRYWLRGRFPRCPAAPRGAAAMPQLHSAAARALRRERAVRRGFVVPPPAGRRFVAVDAAVAPRVRTMARSLEVHAAHDVLTGVHHHYARSATLAARTMLPEDEVSAKLSLHRAANQAKHGSCAAAFGAGAGVRIGPAPPQRRQQAPEGDCVLESVAWPRSEARWVDEAAAGVYAARRPPLADSSAAWAALVDAQNHSIALLVERVDTLVERAAAPSAVSGMSSDVEARLRIVEAQAKRASDVVSDAVAYIGSLRGRLDILARDLKDEVAGRVASYVRTEHFHSLMDLVQIVSASVEEVRSRVDAALGEEMEEELHDNLEQDRGGAQSTDCAGQACHGGGPSRREVPVCEFFAMAQEVRARLPHVVAPELAPLMLCDAPPDWFADEALSHERAAGAGSDPVVEDPYRAADEALRALWAAEYAGFDGVGDDDDDFSDSDADDDDLTWGRVAAPSPPQRGALNEYIPEQRASRAAAPLAPAP